MNEPALQYFSANLFPSHRPPSCRLLIAGVGGGVKVLDLGGLSKAGVTLLSRVSESTTGYTFTPVSLVEKGVYREPREIYF